KRHSMTIRDGGIIQDELDKLDIMDHVDLGGGERFAHLESVRIGQRHQQIAGIALEILHQVFQPLDERAAIGFHRLLYCDRVGREKVGRGEEIHQLAGEEVYLLGILLIVAHVRRFGEAFEIGRQDRKSTRLNSSHVKISYAVFCLKKKN